MKLKNDFVTNSSSASFIINFRARENKLDEHFIQEVCAMDDEDKISFLNNTIKNKDKSFTTTCFTSMFNFIDRDSFEEWVLRLYMHLTINHPVGYELISAKIESDN